MTNKKKRCVEVLLVAGISIILLCSLVAAFGIYVPYTTDFPLEVYPGESKDFKLTLSTKAGEGDVKVQVEIMEGSDIATLTDSSLEYDLASGRGKLVNGKITIPAGTPVGADYSVRFKITEIAPSEEGGTISFGASSEVVMGVRVVQRPPATTPPPEEEASFTWVWLLIVLIVIVLLIIYFVARAKKAPSKPAK